MNLDQLSSLMPNIYFLTKDIRSVFTDSSESLAKLCGFNRLKFQGKKDDDLPCKASELAALFQNEDQLVIKNNKPMQFLTFAQYHTELQLNLCAKNVTLDKNNNINGTFAYFYDVLPVASHIIQIFRKVGDILSVNYNSFLIDHSFTDRLKGIALTERESEVLFLLIHHKMPKQIALLLNLSVRTVEHRITDLRQKFNCQSKAELIDAAIQSNFLTFIPTRFFNNRHLLSE